MCPEDDRVSLFLQARNSVHDASPTRAQASLTPCPFKGGQGSGLAPRGAYAGARDARRTFFKWI